MKALLTISGILFLSFLSLIFVGYKSFVLPTLTSILASLCVMLVGYLSFRELGSELPRAEWADFSKLLNPSELDQLKTATDTTIINILKKSFIILAALALLHTVLFEYPIDQFAQGGKRSLPSTLMLTVNGIYGLYVGIILGHAMALLKSFRLACKEDYPRLIGIYSQESISEIKGMLGEIKDRPITVLDILVAKKIYREKALTKMGMMTDDI